MISIRGRLVTDTLLWGRAFAALVLLTTLSGCTFLRPPQPQLPDRSTIAAGKTVTAKRGENVYTIALQNNVSMRDLIALNGLKPPYELRAGQKVVLPANVGTYGNDLDAPQSAPRETVERHDLAPIMPPSVSSQALEPPPVSSAPVVPPSVSPYASSSASEASSGLQAWNTPTPVVKPAMSTADTAQAPIPPAIATPSASVASSPSSTQVASAGTAMRWPVQGPVVSPYGAKSGGMNNDGVNISAPKGSPVVAAASGTVVYAGNDMKGFGNLVLIKHQGDLVTAYAHLDRVMVKKDFVVAQGDMIGTVGKTGNAPTPQLHFEVRVDGKPVDPSQAIKGGV